MTLMNTFAFYALKSNALFNSGHHSESRTATDLMLQSLRNDGCFLSLS